MYISLYVYISLSLAVSLCLTRTPFRTVFFSFLLTLPNPPSSRSLPVIAPPKTILDDPSATLFQVRLSLPTPLSLSLYFSLQLSILVSLSNL